MEVADFARELRAVVKLVAVHPRILWRVPAGVAAENRHAHRGRATVGVRGRERDRGHRVQSLAALRDDRRSRAADEILHVERGVAVFVADVCDSLSVRGPAGVAAVEVTVSQRQRRRIVGRREPELVPLPAVVIREQDPLAVRADLRPRGPGGLQLVPVETGDRTVRDRNRADLARTPGNLSIGDIPDALPVRCPGRIDEMIVRRIVITVDLALARRDQVTHVPEARGCQVGDLQVEVTAALGRDEDELPAVRRDARLEIDATVRGQRLGLPGREIETAELDRAPVVAAEDDTLAVRCNVRLVVVSGIGMCQFDRDIGLEALSPQGTRHAVNDLVTRWHERRERRPGRRLRDVQLAPVIIVWVLDLRQNRLARRLGRRRKQKRSEQEQCADGGPHAWPASASSRLCRKYVIASSTSASVTHSGGMKRSVDTPQESSSRPLW